MAGNSAGAGEGQSPIMKPLVRFVSERAEVLPEGGQFNASDLKVGFSAARCL